ncbi:ABC transporter permease [Caldiplasma sukawensis]
MNKYLLMRKIIQDVALVIIMTVLTFVVFRLMPGNPAELFFKGIEKNGHPITAQTKEAICAELGLSHGKFSLQDFETYLYQMFTFNWGKDYINVGETVAEEISLALPYTLVLTGSTAILSYVIGVPLGIYISRIRGTKKESAILSTALALNSVPYFIIAILLFLYVSYYTGLFPLYANVPYSEVTTFTPAGFVNLLYHIAMPFISLLVIEMFGHMITMRAAMVSTLGEDHILTAKAKGVSGKAILRRHAARIAIIPVTTRLALQISFLISGSLLVAIIFDWPGMGPLLYNAVLKEDYPLSEAATFVISLMTIIAYSMIDYIHAWLDPRIKV